MKKIITLLLIGTMVLAGSVFAFADTTCELDPEVYEQVTAIKVEFLEAKVADGTLTQEEADAIQVNLDNQTGQDELMSLGYGIWLNESGYMDELSEVLPHKNMGLRPNAQNNGQGQGRELTDEEQEARHLENIENGTTKGGMGRRGNSN